MTLTKQNIETLIVLCKKGNQLAQFEVYNRYQKAMYNVAVRIVKNDAEAEDIMQESFLTAFSKLEMFKGDASFGSWLKRIVINNSITQYKKSQRFIKLPVDIISGELDESFDGICEEEFKNAKASHVLNCMSDINDNYRQVLTLHFIEGFDYEELCEILQISYANCRTLISRAKESLRNKLTVTT